MTNIPYKHCPLCSDMVQLKDFLITGHQWVQDRTPIQLEGRVNRICRECFKTLDKVSPIGLSQALDGPGAEAAHSPDITGHVESALKSDCHRLVKKLP